MQKSYFKIFIIIFLNILNNKIFTLLFQQIAWHYLYHLAE